MNVGPMFFAPASGSPGSSQVLLMHYDGSFLDSSPVGRTMTGHGGIATQATTKQWGAEALEFNGAGWLSTPDTTDLQFQATAWSTDFWLYIPSSGITWATDNVLWAKWGASGNLSLLLGIDAAGRLYMLASNDGTSVAITTLSTAPLPTGAFHHIGFWKPAGLGYYASIDGVIVGSGSGSLFNSSAQFTIGDVDGGGAPMQAGVVVDEFRVLYNASDYATSNFTPPTGPY